MWQNTSVFITGISGFVGGHLARALIAEGAEVTGLLHDMKKKNYLDLLEIRDNVNLVAGSITDVQLLQRIFVDYKPIDAVFHLAAVSIVGKAVLYPLHTYQTNVFGTLALLEACRLALDKPKTILVTSTDKVYGNKEDAVETDSLNGDGIYESSKVNMDVVSSAFFYQYGLPIVTTRSCNIYGMDAYNSRIVPNTIMAMVRGESPVIFEGEDTIREYIHVYDVCDAYMQLADGIDKTKGQAYNVGSGTTISQKDLVLKIVEIGNDVLGTNIKPKYVRRDSPAREIEKQSMNSDKIERDIGWRSHIGLEEGLRMTFLDFVRCKENE